MSSSRFKNIVWIVNSKIRSFKAFKKEISDANFDPHENHKFLYTTHAGHAEELALEACNHSDLIIAVGGDGTAFEVINGMMRSSEKPVLSIFPKGTANDFARNFSLFPNFKNLLHALNFGVLFNLDVGEVHWPKHDKKRYFLNILDVGLGAEVVTRMNSGSRLFGAPLTYLWHITRALLTYKARTLTITIGARNLSPTKTMSFVIANGAWFGNNLKIAPAAKTDDGFFNYTHLGDFSFLEYVTHVPAAKKGREILHRKINYGSGVSFQISGDADLEADGEWLGTLPVEVKCLPKSIKFLTF